MNAPDERAVDPADPQLGAVPLPPQDLLGAALPLPEWDPVPPED